MREGETGRGSRAEGMGGQGGGVLRVRFACRGGPRPRGRAAPSRAAEGRVAGAEGGERDAGCSAEGMGGRGGRWRKERWLRDGRGGWPGWRRFGGLFCLPWRATAARKDERPGGVKNREASLCDGGMGDRVEAFHGGPLCLPGWPRPRGRAAPSRAAEERVAGAKGGKSDAGCAAEGMEDWGGGVLVVLLACRWAMAARKDGRARRN